MGAKSSAGLSQVPGRPQTWSRVRLHFQVRDLVKQGLLSSHLIYAEVYVRRATSVVPEYFPNAVGWGWTRLGRTEARQKLGGRVEWCKGLDVRYWKGKGIKVRLAVYDAARKVPAHGGLIGIADFELDDIVGVRSRAVVEMKLPNETAKRGVNEAEEREEKTAKTRWGKRARKSYIGTALLTAIPADQRPANYHVELEADEIRRPKAFGSGKVRATVFMIRAKYCAGDGDASWVLLHQSDRTFLERHEKHISSLRYKTFISAAVLSEGICHPIDQEEDEPEPKDHGLARVSSFVKKRGRSKKSPHYMYGGANIPLFGDDRSQEIIIAVYESTGGLHTNFELISEVTTSISELGSLKPGEGVQAKLYASTMGRLRLKQVEKGDDPRYFRLRFELPKPKTQAVNTS